MASQQPQQSHRGKPTRSRNSRQPRNDTKRDTTGGPPSTSSKTSTVGTSKQSLTTPFLSTIAPAAIKTDQIIDDDATDSEVCFICASPVIYTAVAPCNHRTCHICSIRMRALYKSKSCAHCRANWDFVIFTDEDKDFETLAEADLSFTDSNLGIKYTKKDIQEDTLLLLRYNCPDPTCDVACLGWPDLHRHVKAVHHRIMCDLCTRHKKVFTHEHELFTTDALKRHEEKGDDKPGTVDQSGFRGHPRCGFCKQHFYSDDELYIHCRERHEKCHICERQNPGRPQYYLNYDTLEKHFRLDHFLCLDRECLEKKFIVFETELDLRAHQLEAHPNGLTKDHRRVDLSDFSLRERYQPQRGRDSQGRGRGRGRGRDTNADPLPVSSAQPLRRDELAFQRQMAIHSSPSSEPAGPSSTRAFHGQLSTPSSLARSAQANMPSRHEPSSSQATQLSASFPTLAADPDNELRQSRHQAVLGRAEILLKGDTSRLDSFRTNVSSYKNSRITAKQLVETLFSLFDTSSVELAKLVKELADIFEIDSKKRDLLTAWNDWRAINEDYPSLPSASGSSGTSSSASGRRVLRLKSATAPSSRSANTASWGTAATATPSASKSSNSLSAILQRPSTRVPSSSTPWSSSSTKALPPRPIRSNDPSNSLGSDTAFPALPQASRPALSAFTPGFNGMAVRRGMNSRTPEPSNNAWGSTKPNSKAGLSDDPSTENAILEGLLDGGESSTKKKGGRKKQTLMHFG